ncbi:hypothetical protein [Aestuariivirga sp.]|uniref:hypothetical protein n=1 Tax=Aestuariivirga sp. TaxID=2650926 RepID=UPI0039E4E3FD
MRYPAYLLSAVLVLLAMVPTALGIVAYNDWGFRDCPHADGQCDDAMMSMLLYGLIALGLLVVAIFWPAILARKR